MCWSNAPNKSSQKRKLLKILIGRLAFTPWIKMAAVALSGDDRVPPRGVGAAFLGRDELPVRLPRLAS